VFELGIAIIKTSNGAGGSSKLDHFDGNFWPFPGSSPDLSSSIRCPHIFLTTGSDTRTMNSRVDVQFAGKTQLPPHHALYVSSIETDRQAACLMQYACSPARYRSRSACVCFIPQSPHPLHCPSPVHILKMRALNSSCYVN
jgi:hypothetical protein